MFTFDQNTMESSISSQASVDSTVIQPVSKQVPLTLAETAGGYVARITQFLQHQMASNDSQFHVKVKWQGVTIAESDVDALHGANRGDMIQFIMEIRGPGGANQNTYHVHVGMMMDFKSGSPLYFPQDTDIVMSDDVDPNIIIEVSKGSSVSGSTGATIQYAIRLLEQGNEQIFIPGLPGGTLEGDGGNGGE